MPKSSTGGYKRPIEPTPSMASAMAAATTTAAEATARNPGSAASAHAVGDHTCGTCSLHAPSSTGSPHQKHGDARAATSAIAADPLAWRRVCTDSRRSVEASSSSIRPRHVFER
eukprot:6205478-Pleurochrysis_carterae.AAC.5